ncbi:hypothetical protein SISNIDRAFT_483137 [Sistotremastrum niveocremeum HHB9708]|uniref:Uncharacterized protein n=1 Tax=Sistotremastrum niveocremeum HHB9708 TaxID=1314777 RepID=A0A164Y4Z6_9AGAM|nr:hypothetical protein SISNIDRAFT_483137 [Sistotremastrum niveocremeum HHB9708]
MRRVLKEVTWLFEQEAMSRYVGLLGKQNHVEELHPRLVYACVYVASLSLSYDAGRKEQRAADVLTIREALTPQFVANKDRIGRWITPYPLEWEDPSVKAQLISKTIKVTHKDMFMFMWLDCTVEDKHTPMADILKSPFIVRLWKTVNAGQISNDDLTIESIAYITALIAVVLLGELDVGDGFDVQAFYFELLKILDEQTFVKADVMGWWRSQLVSGKIGDVADRGYAMMLRMHAEGEKLAGEDQGTQHKGDVRTYGNVGRDRSGVCLHLFGLFCLVLRLCLCLAMSNEYGLHAY